MFIKSPVLCCGENITFHQVAKFSVPLQKSSVHLLICTDCARSCLHRAQVVVCISLPVLYH
ncbi:hypothetical protein EIF27_17000 [Escherichia coli]|nr:hypothetical protein [Escherichia coli]